MPMLSDEEITRQIEVQQHLPGWKFITFREREGLMLRIEAPVLDADTGKPTLLGINTYIPPMRDPEAVDEFIHWRLSRIALHEVDEWHRVNGEPVHRAQHAT
jgi:hypothetical protein